MRHRYLEIASSADVVAARTKIDGVDRYASDGAGPVVNAVLGATEATFIAARDSFYLASTSQTGWPYIQHRGGPKGFLRVLDETTIGFADYRGNKQYLTIGNTAREPRVSLFLMDYTRRRRLKIFGLLEVDDSPDFLAAVNVPSQQAVVERGIRIRVQAFDWNCPQHITPRFTEAEVTAATEPLRKRIAELEAAVARQSAGA